MKCQLAHALVILLQVACAFSFDPTDYLEVYPDPTDPAVLKGRTPLHFALIKSRGSQFNSFGSVAGVKLALDMINNDSSLLPGHTLHYALNDCQVRLSLSGLSDSVVVSSWPKFASCKQAGLGRGESNSLAAYH